MSDSRTDELQCRGGQAEIGLQCVGSVTRVIVSGVRSGLLTTRWLRRESEVREVLGVPDEMTMYAIIPVGKPIKRPVTTAVAPSLKSPFPTASETPGSAPPSARPSGQPIIGT